MGLLREGVAALIVKRTSKLPIGSGSRRHGEVEIRSILSKRGANDWTHALTITLKRGIIELV
jgi:hypothetical protein